jgi:hypothetical protein
MLSVKRRRASPLGMARARADANVVQGGGAALSACGDASSLCGGTLLESAGEDARAAMSAASTSLSPLVKSLAS